MKRYMTDYDDYDDDDDSEGYSNAVDLIQSSVKGHYNRRTKLKTYRLLWFLSKTSLKPLKFHTVSSRYHGLCNDLIIAQVTTFWKHQGGKWMKWCWTNFSCERFLKSNTVFYIPIPLMLIPSFTKSGSCDMMSTFLVIKLCKTHHKGIVESKLTWDWCQHCMGTY